MSRYRTHKVYEERYNNYVNGFHINVVRSFDENAPSVALPVEPVTKDRLKNKNKQRQEAIQQIETLIIGDAQANGGDAQAKTAVRPSWKVNTQYHLPTAGTYRLRLCGVNKAYERDSL